jgi:hypothetical protein
VIDHNNKTVYIAPPRTASQAISHHINSPAGGTITSLRNKLGEAKWAKYRIVGVMRDPITRFVSSWRYYYTLGVLDQKMPSEFYRLLREEFQQQYRTPSALLENFQAAYRRPLIFPFLQPLSESFTDPVTGELGITHLLYPKGMKDIAVKNSLSSLSNIPVLVHDFVEEELEYLRQLYVHDMVRWNTPDLPTVKFKGKKLIPNS